MRYVPSNMVLVKWILPFYLPRHFVNVLPLLLTTQITLSFKFQNAQYMEPNENFAMGNSSHQPSFIVLVKKTRREDYNTSVCNN
jgi:hypothetical protein